MRCAVIVPPASTSSVVAALAFALLLSRRTRWAVGAAGALFRLQRLSDALTLFACSQHLRAAPPSRRDTRPRAERSLRTGVFASAVAHADRKVRRGRTACSCFAGLSPDPPLRYSQSSGFDIHGALDGETARACVRAPAQSKDRALVGCATHAAGAG